MIVPRKIGRRLWAAHSSFQEHEGTLSAARIAYYVALVILSATARARGGVGCDPGVDANRARALTCELLQTIAQQASPDLAKQVDRSLKAVQDRASSGGPIGFLVLIASAIAIFAPTRCGIRSHLAVAGRSARDLGRAGLQRLVFQRLKALGMLIGVGGFIVLAMVASMVCLGRRACTRIAD